jgi:hypothetical protein
LKTIGDPMTDSGAVGGFVYNMEWLVVHEPAMYLLLLFWMLVLKQLVFAHVSQENRSRFARFSEPLVTFVLPLVGTYVSYDDAKFLLFPYSGNLDSPPLALQNLNSPYCLTTTCIHIPTSSNWQLVLKQYSHCLRLFTNHVVKVITEGNLGSLKVSVRDKFNKDVLYAVGLSTVEYQNAPVLYNWTFGHRPKMPLRTRHWLLSTSSTHCDHKNLSSLAWENVTCVQASMLDRWMRVVRDTFFLDRTKCWTLDLADEADWENLFDAKREPARRSHIINSVIGCTPLEHPVEYSNLTPAQGICRTLYADLDRYVALDSPIITNDDTKFFDCAIGILSFLVSGTVDGKAEIFSSKKKRVKQATHLLSLLVLLYACWVAHGTFVDNGVAFPVGYGIITMAALLTLVRVLPTATRD